jgi:putative nucleotidyltransferase with HDIG domain
MIMKKLTLSEAKKLAEEFSKKIKDPEKKDSFLLHSKSVVDAAKAIAEGRALDMESLEIACWLHDIGRSVADEDHAKQSLALLKEYELNETIKDCILNHGRESNPQTKEGKIIQLADKVCVLNIDLLREIMKQNKGKIKEEHIKFLKKTTERAIKLLENFDNSLK